MTNIIYRPCAVTLTATGKDVTFIPYKENFTYTIHDGDSVQFEVKKAEEVMYYYMQVSDNLSIEQVASNSELSDTVSYTTITINNTSDVDFHFVPFNENFGFTVKSGDSLVFDAPIIVADSYYKNLELDGVSITYDEPSTASFKLNAINCWIKLYKKEADGWSLAGDTKRGITTGALEIGAEYHPTLPDFDFYNVSIFRCNGEDLIITDEPDDSTVLIATEEGFDIIAVGHGGDSSEDY